MYYADKIESLRTIFGTHDLRLTEKSLVVGAQEYPIVNDVILIEEKDARRSPEEFAEDIQYTFGAEWTEHPQILPEHEKEFHQYFDLTDLSWLENARVADIGCGSGRWSYFLRQKCRELVLVDFSDAIFVARENLKDAPNALFFKGDLTRLPFAANFADFLFCLGVLHHLPTPCLDAVKGLKKYSPKLLIFLYYALDNRPFYFRWLLALVTAVRRVLSHIRWRWFRNSFSYLGALLIYRPIIVLGHLFEKVGWGRYVPLYEFYKDKSMKRIEQDVYDRFFTRIEQRVSRVQIMTLKNDFSEIRISNAMPYWHFEV